HLGRPAGGPVVAAARRAEDHPFAAAGPGHAVLLAAQGNLGAAAGERRAQPAAVRMGAAAAAALAGADAAGAERAERRGAEAAAQHSGEFLKRPAALPRPRGGGCRQAGAVQLQAILK